MIFKTNITLSWNIDRVVDALNDLFMMQKVASPLVVFKAVKPAVFHYRWENEGACSMSMYLFGVLPLGWQEISIQSKRTDTEAILTDIGPGFSVKLWDHKVIVRKDGKSRTHLMLKKIYD